MTIIFIIIKGLMEFKTPDFDNEMMVTWGLLFLYIVVVLEAIDRFSRTVAINMTIATLGAIGYYFLSSHLFSEAGQTMVKGWIG